MKFGGRVVEQVTLFNVWCQATNAGGDQAIGFGSMTMGVAWAWPSQTLSAIQTLQIVIDLAEQFVAEVQKLLPGLPGHPLDICAASHPLLESIADRIQRSAGISEPIPAIARLLAASPLQAALFDVYGKAAGKSSFAMLGGEYLDGDLSRFLGPNFQGAYLDSFVSAEPIESLPLYHLVGALDPLDDEDVETAVNDGLPETLRQWIKRDQLTHLKIKLDGSDPDWDRQRVIAVDRIANECAEKTASDVRYSLDFNERCQDEAYVLRLLDYLEQSNSSLTAKISYIEQPTHRDLQSHPENTMFRVAARLPVVIDESLTDHESLLFAGTRLQRRGNQGLQGARRRVADGGGGQTLRNVLVRSGPNLRGRVVLAFRFADRSSTRCRSYRGKRTSVLPGSQFRFRRTVSWNVRRLRWSTTDSAIERSRLRVLNPGSI